MRLPDTRPQRARDSLCALYTFSYLVSPPMVPPFDIFRRQNGGSARWLEVVTDLETARLRIKELAESVPGEYFVFSLAVGRRLKPDEVLSETETRV